MEMLKKYWPLLLILLVSFASYQASLSNDFTHLDDQVQVVNNPNIRALNAANIKAIFSSTSVGMYQPFSTFIYALVYQLAGINPWAYHLASLLFHLTNCLLLFKVLQGFKLKQNLIYFVTAIFALHPMQVESVAWVSAFSNLCFTTFYLAAFWAYQHFQASKKQGHYFLSLLLFIASALSKSTAVTFPLALIVFDLYQTEHFKLKSLLNKIPFFVVSIIIGIITLNSRESAGHLSDLSISFDLFDRIFLIAYSILFYPFKFLIPLELSAFYPYPDLENGLLPWQYYAALPTLLIIAFVFYRFRENKLAVFGALFYLVSISVMLQLIPVGNQLTTDRYLYLPMVGLLLIVASLIKTQKRNIWIATVIIGFLLAAKTKIRSKVWANDKLIWEDVIDKHPKVAQAHNNLGSYLLRSGKPQQAFKHFDQAVKLKPYYADAYSNRGNLYSQMGESRQAMADFNTAIELRPHADAYFNRANERVKTGKLKAAILDYSESIKLNPSADAFTNRAYAYLQMGNVKAAQNDLQKVMQSFPNFAQAYFLSGMIAEKQNNLRQACQFFQQAANLGDEKARQAVSRFCR